MYGAHVARLVYTLITHHSGYGKWCSWTTTPLIGCVMIPLDTRESSHTNCMGMHYISNPEYTSTQWGLCASRHGIQISMEAILACHPARSTEWLDCHSKSCELWRIRTGPISQGDHPVVLDSTVTALWWKESTVKSYAEEHPLGRPRLAMFL